MCLGGGKKVHSAAGPAIKSKTIPELLLIMDTGECRVVFVCVCDKFPLLKLTYDYRMNKNKKIKNMECTE